MMHQQPDQSLARHFAFDGVIQDRSSFRRKRRSIARAAPVDDGAVGQDRKETMAELRMLSAGPADMREVGLDARAHSGSPAAEACRRESPAPVVFGRIERCDRHGSCDPRRDRKGGMSGMRAYVGVATGCRRNTKKKKNKN